MTLAPSAHLGHIEPVSDEPKSQARETPDPNALNCPTCGEVVDPRRTTQALSRNGRLLLFCSSGCLRQYLADERAKA
jgi:hypothetical protein